MFPCFARLCRLTLCLMLLAFWATASASAQSTFGSLNGTITDPTGAVAPVATVGVSNTQTQASRAVVSAGDGGYLVPNLDAGAYLVTVSLSGFADWTREVSILARQVVRVDT